MGLDQYLTKRTYVKKWEHDKKEEQVNITVQVGGNPHPTIDTEKISYIIEEVGYWRKFNSLQKYAVENWQNGIDNCKEYYVSKEQLEKLKRTLERLLETKDTSLFPTKSGFFFGGLEYDEYYWEQVNYTLELVKKCLTTDGDYFYQSSW